MSDYWRGWFTGVVSGMGGVSFAKGEYFLGLVLIVAAITIPVMYAKLDKQPRI